MELNFYFTLVTTILLQPHYITALPIQPNQKIAAVISIYVIFMLFQHNGERIFLSGSLSTDKPHSVDIPVVLGVHLKED